MLSSKMLKYFKIQIPHVNNWNRFSAALIVMHHYQWRVSPLKSEPADWKYSNERTANLHPWSNTVNRVFVLPGLCFCSHSGDRAGQQLGFSWLNHRNMGLYILLRGIWWKRRHLHMAERKRLCPWHRKVASLSVHSGTLLHPRLKDPTGNRYISEREKQEKLSGISPPSSLPFSGPERVKSLANLNLTKRDGQKHAEIQLVAIGMLCKMEVHGKMGILIHYIHLVDLELSSFTSTSFLIHPKKLSPPARCAQIHVQSNWE